MPLPLVALAPLAVGIIQQAVALIGRVGIMRLIQGSAAGGLVLEFGSALVTGDPGALSRELLKAAAKVVEYEADIELHDDEPFSGNSLGYAVEQKTGVPIRNLYDKVGVREDLEQYALDQFSMKTGYRLSSLRDGEKIKSDVVMIGLSLVEERTQIPLSAVMSSEDPKQALIDHFTPMVIDRLTREIDSRDINAESLISAIQAKTGNRFTAAQVTKALNNKLLQQSLQLVAKKRELPPDTRRRLQNRAAQAKFRAKHGNRTRYVPLSEGVYKGPKGSDQT